MIDQAGNVYFGEFKNGLLSGEGRITLFGSNESKSGWFKNGTYVSTVYRHYFDQVFMSPPDFPPISPRIVYQWKLAKPLPIDQLVQAGNLTYSESIPLINIKTKDYFYSGQDFRTRGIGRFQSKDFIVEGEFRNRTPTGFSRLIKSNQEVYEGQLNNFRIEGIGKLTFTNGTFLQGYLHANQFFETRAWYDLMTEKFKEAPSESSAGI